MAVRKARKLWLGVLGLVIVLGAAVSAVFEWSGASLAGDPVALARVHVEPFGGTLQSARAVGPGRPGDPRGRRRPAS